MHAWPDYCTKGRFAPSGPLPFGIRDNSALYSDPAPALPVTSPLRRAALALVLALLGLLGRLPLRFYHALGAVLGQLAYRFSPKFAERLRDNLRCSGVCEDKAAYRRVLRANIAETGKQAIEFIALWFRPERSAAALVRSCRGEDEVLAAYREGKGVILLTPHLGCFEVSAIYAAQRFPITVLYRPPRVAWLEPIIVAGRGRGNEKLAPANLKGVRSLFRAVKSGEALGILPDQAPSKGEGIWVDFFGRPAYTMTLVGRLWETTQPAVFVAAALRRPRGEGFDIVVRRVQGDLSGREGARRINAAVEDAVRLCPEQYLWGYHRYKTPAGAPPPAQPLEGSRC
jgi:KDO2-lipid IV(A) lauroyltransferase